MRSSFSTAPLKSQMTKETPGRVGPARAMSETLPIISNFQAEREHSPHKRSTGLNDLADPNRSWALHPRELR
jgi:hypothetical protein